MYVCVCVSECVCVSASVCVHACIEQDCCITLYHYLSKIELFSLLESMPVCILKCFNSD